MLDDDVCLHVVPLQPHLLAKPVYNAEMQWGTFLRDSHFTLRLAILSSAITVDSKKVAKADGFRKMPKSPSMRCSSLRTRIRFCCALCLPCPLLCLPDRPSRSHVFIALSTSSSAQTASRTRRALMLLWYQSCLRAIYECRHASACLSIRDI